MAAHSVTGHLTTKTHSLNWPWVVEVVLTAMKHVQSKYNLFALMTVDHQRWSLTRFMVRPHQQVLVRIPSLLKRVLHATLAARRHLRPVLLSIHHPVPHKVIQNVPISTALDIQVVAVLMRTNVKTNVQISTHFSCQNWMRIQWHQMTSRAAHATLAPTIRSPATSHFLILTKHKHSCRMRTAIQWTLILIIQNTILLMEQQISRLKFFQWNARKLFSARCTAMKDIAVIIHRNVVATLLITRLLSGQKVDL